MADGGGCPGTSVVPMPGFCMSNERRGHQHEGSRLPPELAEFLRTRERAALLQGSDQGTVLIVKLPGREIEAMPNPVAIHIRQELYRHEQAPVIRLVISIYDRPRRPLALESFVNVGDPFQRRDYEGLTRQDQLYMLFYDEALEQRLAKVVPHPGRHDVYRVLREADALLRLIPPERFDFDRAKEAVIAQTRL